MRTCVWLIACLCLARTALAEDKPNPEQLKKAYDDALVQLKAAQNSKNELAKDNEKLSKQLEELKKQLAAADVQLQDMKRQISDNDEKSYNLRSYCATWRAFLRAYPELMARWKSFLADDPLAAPAESRPLIDPKWLLPDETAESARG